MRLLKATDKHATLYFHQDEIARPHSTSDMDPRFDYHILVDFTFSEVPVENDPTHVTSMEEAIARGLAMKVMR